MENNHDLNYILVSTEGTQKPLSPEANPSDNEIVKEVISSMMDKILLDQVSSQKDPSNPMDDKEKIVQTSNEVSVPFCQIEVGSEPKMSMKEMSTKTSDLINVRDNWTTTINPGKVDVGINIKPETAESSSNTSPPHSYQFLVGRSESVVNFWSEETFPYYQNSSIPLRILNDEDEQFLYEEKTVEEIPVKSQEQIVPAKNSPSERTLQQVGQETFGAEVKKAKRVLNSKKSTKGLKNAKLYDPEFYWEKDADEDTNKENSPEHVVPSAGTETKRKLSIRTGLSKKNLKSLHPNFNPDDLISDETQDD